MRSPTAPGGTPDPGLIAGHPAQIANAVGPEVIQQGTGAARFLGSFMFGAVAGGRDNGATGDVRSPQVFINHFVHDAVSTTAVGDETAQESLPGRLRASSWDGEPGWAAAIGGS